jgi:hypothetical protein
MNDTNNSVRSYSSYLNTRNIVKAHILANKSLLIWGSSGNGKSQSVTAFSKELSQELAKECGFECFVLPMADKSSIDMFAMGIVDGKLVEFPAWWIRKLTDAVDENGNKYPPMFLFLDEITRAHQSMLPIIMEIANDHTIAGRKIRGDVFIIAASNFDREDGGHQDLTLNQAGMRRFTHVTHQIDYNTFKKYATGLNLELIEMRGPSCITYFVQKHFFDVDGYDHKQLACARQQTDAIAIIEAGMDFLDDNEISTILCGRLGLEYGEILAEDLRILREKKKEVKIPEELTYDNFHVFKKLESTGQQVEVYGFLLRKLREVIPTITTEESKRRSIIYTNYLYEMASPEVVSYVLSPANISYTDSVRLEIETRDGKFKDVNIFVIMKANGGCGKLILNNQSSIKS